ncbi:Legume-like lectin family protein [Tritrichomonas foetus]|uniref:Legume-like lectin family protein n=1 Tax=Tritrichomonas foetus TaxID=1144522 RepID=A0A1J4J1W6_9EUKA|nr:Legume-like lectin family protein [Tritrichomonas foetus]|eukprot:OHS92753.1 Legume-like lectin family protein [Tritrichomonas foetus]
MIFLFLYLSYSSTEEYNLVPPLYLTNLNEVGNWSLRGTAANIKKAIRLTSNIPDQLGRACSLIPTYFYEWGLEIEFSIHGGNGGEYIFIFFTEDVCPKSFRSFKGFAYAISLVEVNESFPVYYVNGSVHFFNPKIMKPVGHISLKNYHEAMKNRNKDKKIDHSNDVKKLTLHLTRAYGRIQLESSFDFSFDRIVTENSADTLKFGYFSIVGMTESKFDNIDLVSFRLNPLSDFDKSLQDDFAAKNRQIIENRKRERFVSKRARRLKMPTTLKLLDYMNRTMENIGEFTLKDGMRIITEMEKRLKSSVSVDDLSKFIEEKVEKTVEKAYAKIQLASQKFEESNTEISEMWANLRTQLLNLAVESAQDMKKIQNEVLEKAKKINIKTLDKKAVKESLTNEVDVDDSLINRMLLVISIIEIVCYCFFFFIKHQETHGFKKRD